MSTSEQSETNRRHGAFKTPGGKLVIVDFALDRGRLRDVVVSGDFFLYPESAIEPLTAALQGLPADLPPARIADRVAAALPPGVEFLGSSPEAVAEAVRRALASETDDD
ncbi:MAG TPA: biotin--protein ligase [Thermomicrobiales bacterium]|jgi:lipoate-protein ligase A|nr:biotin--protein ligase [Thermomicrobiales bacterium]